MVGEEQTGGTEREAEVGEGLAIVGCGGGEGSARGGGGRSGGRPCPSFEEAGDDARGRGGGGGGGGASASCVEPGEDGERQGLRRGLGRRRADEEKGSADA